MIRKIIILFITIFLQGNNSIFSQCGLLELPQEVEQKEEINSSGDPSLDMAIRSEIEHICGVFGLNPVDFAFYDDENQPNAWAKCGCDHSNCSGTVRLGRNLLRKELTERYAGDYAVVGILAHEIAHVLQCRKGWSSNNEVRELHADFLAGYYMAVRSYYTYTNINSFAASLFEKGSYDIFRDDFHGTPEQRVQSMTLGALQANFPLNEAYNLGYQWLAEDAEEIIVEGLWSSSTGNIFQVYMTEYGLTYVNQLNQVFNGLPAGKTNMYYAPIYDNWGNLLEIFQITVVSETRIIVGSNLGRASLWTKQY